MRGYAILLIGIVLLWAALTGRAKALWDAIFYNGSSP